VCDRFRADCGRRPDIDTARPDVRIHVFLTRQDYTLYLDTSGEALFKRGYRREAGEAPLRENLAAGILRLTGWTPGEPLLDPMCGSGTFLVEAARMALGIAPGSQREFGFERLAGHDAQLWARVRAGAQAADPETPLRIYGSDRDAAAIAASRQNLESAGLAGRIELAVADVTGISAPADNGVIVMNPPYGVRLGQADDTLAAFYPRLGDALKKNFAGWRAYIFTGDLRLPKLIGLAPSRRTPLFNGAIECRLYEFKLVSGSMRRK
jgi:putative N6-adenine-specific DNA methylase